MPFFLYFFYFRNKFSIKSYIGGENINTKNCKKAALKTRHDDAKVTNAATERINVESKILFLLSWFFFPSHDLRFLKLKINYFTFFKFSF